MIESEAYKILAAASNIKIGDTVKITRAAKTYELGWGNCWAIEMSKMVGKTAVVASDPTKIHGIHLNDEISGEALPFSYPFFIFEKVKSAKPARIDVPVCSEYKAAVFKNQIVIGCQTFSVPHFREIVKEIEGALTKLHR